MVLLLMLLLELVLLTGLLIRSSPLLLLVLRLELRPKGLSLLSLLKGLLLLSGLLRLLWLGTLELCCLSAHLLQSVHHQVALLVFFVSLYFLHRELEKQRFCKG